MAIARILTTKRTLDSAVRGRATVHAPAAPSTLRSWMQTSHNAEFFRDGASVLPRRRRRCRGAQIRQGNATYRVRVS